MVSRVMMGAAVAAMALTAAGCGGGTSQSESQAEAPAASAAGESHAEHAGGRVFFVSPRDGETIKPNHRFEFGSEQYTIAQVPPDDSITEEQVRAGTGHFHLGLDQDCVPAGEVIPRGDPTWIHFGTGNSTIDMQALEPGEHKFTVQAGDDLHRGVAGLCETITVTVAE